MKWCLLTCLALSCWIGELSAKHIHYFGKDSRYFGRFDVGQFVEKFIQNGEQILSKYHEKWQISPIEGSRDTYILEEREPTQPAYVVVEFTEVENGAGIVTLTTRQKDKDQTLTDAMIIFEDSADMTPFPKGIFASNNAYFVKMMQSFVVYVIAQQQAKLQEAGQSPQSPPAK